MINEHIELEKRVIESVKKIMGLTDEITLEEASGFIKLLSEKRDTRRLNLFLKFLASFNDSSV